MKNTNLNARISVKHPTKVTIWGCMAASGIGRLHILQGMVNGPKYIDILFCGKFCCHLLEVCFTAKDVLFKDMHLSGSIFQADLSGFGPLYSRSPLS